MDNWTSGSATISIMDDEQTMTVSLPASGWEGKTLSGHGADGRHVDCPDDGFAQFQRNHPVDRAGDGDGPAGARSATFTATLVDNGLRTGPQTEQMTATAGGFPTATANVDGQRQQRGPLWFQHDQQPEGGGRAVLRHCQGLRPPQQRDHRVQRHGNAVGHGRGRRAVDQPRVGRRSSMACGRATSPSTRWIPA